MNSLKFNYTKLISFIMFLMLCLSMVTGCQSSNGDGSRSQTLLDNVVSKDGKGYEFEQIPWFTEKSELMKERGLRDEDVTMIPKGEMLTVNKKVAFKKPKVEATIIYNFQDDQFVSGEYVITADNEDDLVRISTELKEMLDEFSEPSSNTLDELAEEAIRDGTSSGVRWFNEDNNSFVISIPEPKSKYILTLSVHAPIEGKKRLKE